jgi:diphthamide synthase subunit DPH2
LQSCVSNLASMGLSASSSARIPCKLLAPSTPTTKRKEKLDNIARNMSVDLHPLNTIVRRQQTSSQSKMAEITETQGKEIVINMQKLSNMEEMKVLIANEIVEKQL